MPGEAALQAPAPISQPGVPAPPSPPRSIPHAPASGASELSSQEVRGAALTLPSAPPWGTVAAGCLPNSCPERRHASNPRGWLGLPLT